MNTLRCHHTHLSWILPHIVMRCAARCRSGRASVTVRAITLPPVHPIHPSRTQTNAHQIFAIQPLSSPMRSPCHWPIYPQIAIGTQTWGLVAAPQVQAPARLDMSPLREPLATKQARLEILKNFARGTAGTGQDQQLGGRSRSCVANPCMAKSSTKHVGVGLRPFVSSSQGFVGRRMPAAQRVGRLLSSFARCCAGVG